MNALLALIALVLLLGSGSFSTSAQAQESPPSSNDVASLKTLHSSGLTAALVKVTIPDKGEIAPQITLQNDSKTRIYVMDARTDDSQVGFLGSGLHLNSPNTAGISWCNSSAKGCAAPAWAALENYSYIEPGDTLSLSLIYTNQGELKGDETLSFSLALIARYAKPNADPSDVGEQKVVRFNFPFVPLVRK